MPCSSDGYEQTGWEKERQRAAKLLIWLQRKLGVEVDPYIIKLSETYWCDDDEGIVQLCGTLKRMSEDQINTIVYNARDKNARALADWWEEHQEIDAKRDQKEAEEDRKKKLRESALKKLTKEERKALGI